MFGKSFAPYPGATRASDLVVFVNVLAILPSLLDWRNALYHLRFNGSVPSGEKSRYCVAKFASICAVPYPHMRSMPARSWKNVISGLLGKIKSRGTNGLNFKNP